MLTMLTAPVYTLLLLGVIVGLGAALVWMLWEFEQIRLRRRRARFGAVARPPRRDSLR